MPVTAEPTVLTVPAGASFVDALAARLLREAGEEPIGLADILVLLPNRRSCRALREAFLRVAGGRPLMLPDMRPIGEADEDELLIADALPGGGIDLPPAIPPLRRLLLLAELIRQHGSRGQTVSSDQATRLAFDLARLIDQVQTERLEFGGLDRLVPDTYSLHWQKTLEFLKVVTEHWPACLAAEGCLDPADRRNRLIDAQIASWRAAPPERRVVAAGSTGSIPAVADLIDTVARLPRGSVVLPGLDREPDAATLAAAAQEPTHPQYGMLRLLARMGLDPAEVEDWPTESGTGDAAEHRRVLVREVLRPAATTDAWRHLPPISATAVEYLDGVDCPNETVEAEVVALALRNALEEAGCLAALVTPDRGLARRVTAVLQRWGVGIDDSAGTPLAHTAPGTFLNLTAEMVRERFRPVSLLAALKHPLAACGRDRDDFRTAVRQLERLVLRGPRPGEGLAGLSQALAHRTEDLTDETLVLLTELEAAMQPLTDAFAPPEAPLANLLDAHLAAAENLASNHESGGAERLWAGEDGEALATFFAEAKDAAGAIGPVATSGYPAMLSAMMTGRVVRPKYGRHPRLHIWGPLEARLQQVDFVVLGGLNEGNWPREPDPDPWMSRPMQAEFGLPLPERRIGLSAHDFASALATPRVLLTRSEKSDGAPTVPSRWIARLDAVLEAGGRARLFGGDSQWLHWQQALDRPPETSRLAPPAPTPPQEARPRQLSVTRIETWMRDPYSIFARHILRLRPLDPLEADPAAAERGIVIHETLDRFVREFPEDLPQDAEEQLLRVGQTMFADLIVHPVVRAFWWPRFQRIARWFVAIERRRRQDILASSTEVEGSLTIEAPGGAFTLTAIADRIDRRRDGGYEVLDYKTGQPPTVSDVRNGYAPQLPLEAAIARAGGFDTLAERPVATFAFWRLSGGDPPGSISAFDIGIDELADEALAGLCRLVTAFDDERTPYVAVPDPSKEPQFNDYEHLARIAEWRGAQNGDES